DLRPLRERPPDRDPRPPLGADRPLPDHAARPRRRRRRGRARARRDRPRDACATAADGGEADPRARRERALVDRRRARLSSPGRTSAREQRRAGWDDRPMRPSRVAYLAAALLFVAACAGEYGGLFSHSYPGDTVTYAKYGRALVNDGRVPYRDFYDEYPPGSVPLFAAPALIWDAHYVLVFKLLMTACGIGFVLCAVWILARLGLGFVRLAPAILAPPLMGPVFLNRYDPLPAFLCSLAL